MLVYISLVPICACIHQSCAYMCLYTSVLCLYVLVYVSFVPICACIRQFCMRVSCLYAPTYNIYIYIYIYIYTYSPVPICAICVSSMLACAYMHVTYLCVPVCVLCLCVLVCCICPVPTCACLYIPSYMRLHAMFV